MLLLFVVPNIYLWVISFVFITGVNYVLYNLFRYVISSMSVQLDLARKLHGKVYVFDTYGYFSTGAIIVKNNVRYLHLNGDRAVLSSASQLVFSKFFYRLVCQEPLQSDDIGLYIIV